MSDDVLRAPLLIEYPFSRTLGPAQTAFFTGLREGIIVGAKGANGQVIVPPVEYDPLTGEALEELVEVGQAGEVTSWAWVNEPGDKHVLDHPFAFALIKLDGADQPMVHVVDAGDESAMSTGMRVQVRWKDEREGHINDIEAFVPEGTA
ncbi:hypothetical protein B7486_52705 [cyanobacterium TDX16]|nr:hypothetical protein B7486_52705 [cyanobacterium TDX16]